MHYTFQIDLTDVVTMLLLIRIRTNLISFQYIV